jgi:hypothetical protein
VVTRANQIRNAVLASAGGNLMPEIVVEGN